jgi:predicted nucleotidyltransferase
MELPFQIKKTLEEFKRELKKLYRDKFVKLVLYGSYARGEETEDSDVDVAVILKGDIVPFDEIDRMGDVAYDLCLKYNILLSTHPISEEKYNSYKNQFLSNLKEEGIWL